ncbi:ribosomal protein L11 methyltransferase [Tribonema minus]|uniref:ETFB lysine methyltransferase n=1 Tax=Tribonema minus TaxID=303371 RepID=A0A835Z7L3_9STRA|nr:ribosomal protein L11 methyltransferase [Tribonema minus]
MRTLLILRAPAAVHAFIASAAINRGALQASTACARTAHRDGANLVGTLVEEDNDGYHQWWGEDTQLKALRIPCSDCKGNVLDAGTLMGFLSEVGALSVTAEDAARGTDQEIPLLHEHDASLGLETTWTNIASGSEYWANTTVTAHFPRDWELQGTIDMIEQVFNLPCALSFSVDDIQDKDWVKSVQQTWHPITLGNLRIRFPWHDALNEDSAGTGQVELCLEGGRAFGTGEHPTTRMCCTWLERCLQVSPGARVLDYGSGSGLLGLAALKYGASEAIGIEVDVDAILSSLYNAQMNDLDIKFYHPREVLNDEGQVERVEFRQIQAAAAPAGFAAGPVVQQLEHPFDLTVANILAGCLIRTEPAISAMTRSGGLLAMSGVLHYQADEVMKAYSKHFYDIMIAEQDGEWVLITATKK